MNGVANVGGIREGIFATTRWSVVRASAGSNEAQAREALAELCQTYWKPVYACVRHQGYSTHDAEDLTQDFFLRLLDGRRLKYLDQAKGRFRAYLSVALQHFLCSRWRWRWTLRRGRAVVHLALDVQGAERKYGLAASTHLTPSLLYEREWARTVIGGALEQLRSELQAKGRQVLFQHFESMLSGTENDFSHEEAARMLNLSPGALHTDLHRWRKRFGTLLREEIARTVSSKEEVEDELQHLLSVFAETSPGLSRQTSNLPGHEGAQSLMAVGACETAE